MDLLCNIEGDVDLRYKSTITCHNSIYESPSLITGIYFLYNNLEQTYLSTFYPEIIRFYYEDSCS